MLTKLLLVFTIAGGVLFTGPAVFKKYHKITTIQSEQNVVDLEIPITKKLKSPLILPKLKQASKTITLESKNIVIFRGPVTSESASQVQREMLKLSRRLNEDAEIYLILNTPGGSVGAGLDLIDFMRALPQKIHTITLFAASMGFQIAQNMDTRFISPNGTLMSHRARLGGLGGQLDGELESRYLMIKRKVDYLDAIAAKRMSLSVAQYKKMIVNEYWVHGFDSVDEKAADEMVNLRCGKSLNGLYEQEFNTMWGTIVATFSRCPLIQAPVSMSLKNVVKGNTQKLQNLFNKAFTNKRQYVKEYIMTGEHIKMFGM